MSPAPTRVQPPKPAAAPRTPRTLELAREACIAAIRRDTPGTDLPRYVEVFDALLAWSATHPTHLAFRADTSASGVISFERVGSKGVFWAVRPSRGNAPTLEIAPPAGASLTAAGREKARTTLNAHSRVVLADGDRLRIGFGALKNAAARTAVLALLEDLLIHDGPDAIAAQAAGGAQAAAATGSATTAGEATADARPLEAPTDATSDYAAADVETSDDETSAAE